MSRATCPTVLATAAGILLLTCQSTQRVRACAPEVKGGATLVIDNKTGDEILVYIDGIFAGRSAPWRTVRTPIEPDQQIVIVGRSMCDSWGPFTVEATPGASKTVRFTEVQRHFPGERD